MARTRVSILEYPMDAASKVMREDFETSRHLNEHITSLKTRDSSKAEDGSNVEIKLRLFVVEDLSREVIETLGSQYDVDPSFFREHLVDYVWYNISMCST